MAYSFLVIDTYYPKFVEKFYSSYNQDSSYEEHWQALMDEELFGTSNFYSKNLKELGCEAREVVFNDIVLQQKWMQEHDLKAGYYSFYRNYLCFKIINRLSIIPWEYKLPYKILKAQIDFYRPDILYVQDITIDNRFLHDIRNSVKLIVGQTAYPLPRKINLKGYDLILTSFPHFVSRFRKMGINSEYFRIAFEPTVLERIGMHDRVYNCSFVGGISKAHRHGTKLLEGLANKVDIDFFGYGVEKLPKNSVIRKKHHGEVWGKEMYKVLAQSKITINRHIDVSENFANNMRLYEATGCGAMLITDVKDNLNELFDIGKEVVVYNNVNELVDLIKYYVDHDFERETIAMAGQKRTITEHTYYNRMEELLNILPKYMR